MPYGPERKNVVSHTVLATPALGLGAYASLGLREGFANPVHTSPVDIYTRDKRYILIWKKLKDFWTAFNSRKRWRQLKR
jgi:hypothetical protein